MIAVIFFTTQAFAQIDALPSRSDTATKKSLFEFVTKISAEGADPGSQHRRGVLRKSQWFKA